MTEGTRGQSCVTLSQIRDSLGEAQIWPSNEKKITSINIRIAVPSCSKLWSLLDEKNVDRNDRE